MTTYGLFYHRTEFRKFSSLSEFNKVKIVLTGAVRQNRRMPITHPERPFCTERMAVVTVNQGECQLVGSFLPGWLILRFAVLIECSSQILIYRSYTHHKDGEHYIQKDTLRYTY